MRITYGQLQIEVKNLINISRKAHLDKIMQLNKTDFLFAFSNPKKSTLFLSLNTTLPFFSLVHKEELPQTNSLNPFLQVLRKELQHSQIQDVILLNADRIVCFTVSLISPTYQILTRKLVIELFCYHPNLLILDEQDIILGVYKPSKSIEVSRPLLKGLHYELPQKNFTCHSVHENITLKEIFGVYQASLAKKSIGDQYEKLFVTIRQKTDTLLRKRKTLNKELEKAFLSQNDFIKGNLLLTYIADIPPNASQITFEEQVISLDPQLSVVENANRYFKRYQKGRKAVKYINEQQIILEEEIAYFALLQQQISEGNAEDISQIQEELKELGYLKKDQKEKRKKINKAAYLPYFILCEGEKIAFGKNNYQNDYLTFTLAQKNHHFFHLKNLAGAHVVILAKTPNDNLLRCAAELSLLLANMECGEVSHTQVKHLKKAGKPGLVVMSDHQDIFLKEISKYTKDIFKTAKRF